MKVSADKDWKTAFIRCECQGEGMSVDYYSDEELYYISYWSIGLDNKKLTWWNRLRHCWQVLIKGKAFNDQLILNQKAADELAGFLNNTRPGFPVGNIDFGSAMEEGRVLHK